jgi:hypothetical protein
VAAHHGIRPAEVLGCAAEFHPEPLWRL